MEKSTRFTIAFIISSLIMAGFSIIKILLLLGYIKWSNYINHLEILCFALFIPPFTYMVRDVFSRFKRARHSYKYVSGLNQSLVGMSRTPSIYNGLIDDVSKDITSKISGMIGVDRCSIWLYNYKGNSIECEEMYIAKERSFSSGAVLSKKDYPEYFKSLNSDPIIIANDATTHPSTACFKDSYLDPLGIKSMLDVPIFFSGKVIGVICAESFTKREWRDCEINYMQNCSSIYSFSYSVYVNSSLKKDILDLEKFIDESVIVSKADSKGKITYVNKKFTEISGYTLEEVIGKDHNIVNSGVHPKEIWTEMYRRVVKERKVWNTVVTNRSKNGTFYHVDTYIRGEFDQESGKLLGFTSIRQDVTDIIQLNDKLNNLVASQTAYVLRTDMEGRHTYWNKKFEDEFGWVYEGNMMHGNSLLSICESHHGLAVKAVKECIANPGKIVKVELDKPHKDGSRRTTFWEFVGILDKGGVLMEIQCMGIDITERVKAEKKIMDVLKEVERKNTYLEHAAKILRHDMHSGINTYIPRGISSLERRLNDEIIKDLKIEAPLKMIKEGLKHTQKVYRGVYEFTNLVKKDACLNKESHDLKKILEDYLSSTAYKSQVIISDLGSLEVNESLFCTSIDNLIRNGLRYNDSNSKEVRIKREGKYLLVEDNGRGMSSKDFKKLSQPYVRKDGQAETGTGLGLNICKAILEEHGFSIDSSILPQGGTQIKIKLTR